MLDEPQPLDALLASLNVTSNQTPTNSQAQPDNQLSYNGFPQGSANVFARPSTADFITNGTGSSSVQVPLHKRLSKIDQVRHGWQTLTLTKDGRQLTGKVS